MGTDQNHAGSQNFVCLAMIGAGTLCIAAAISDWDWFFNNWRARFVVGILGRQAARAVYFVLGALFAVIGLCFVFG